MFNATELFVERLKDHLKLLNRYLRYIFNGHFMIALLFMIVTGAVYYQQWLSTLSTEFPSSLVIAIIFGLLVCYNPLQLFLKEPDKVFLIVKETEMQRYFLFGLLYNYIFQLYIVLIVIAVVSPLYTTMFMAGGKEVILLTIVILVFKAWNMLINWNMMKIRNNQLRIIDQVIRILISIAIFYFIIMGALLFAGITTGLFFLIYLNNYVLARRQNGLAWDVLIENDEHRLGSFYRIVSMFANVPEMKKRLKKRKVLAAFVRKIIPFRNNTTYDYLYRLTFIRSGDYISMYIRLIIIGSLAIIFIPNVWLKVVLALLFIYMANFQMVTLFYHYRTTIWIDLYPVSDTVRKKAFVTFMIQLTLIQTVIFSVLFLFWLDISSFFLTLALGTLFNYLFNYYYVKNRIEKV